MRASRRVLIVVSVIGVALAGSVAVAAGPAVAAGRQTYAFVTKVDGSRRTVNFYGVDWFWGAAANLACREDGQPIGDDEFCHDYYYRDHGKRMRSLPVDWHAKITVLDSSGKSRNGKLADLTKPYDFPVTLTISGGRIRQISQVFVP